jgi:hypothetical protein
VRDAGTRGSDRLELGEYVGRRRGIDAAGVGAQVLLQALQPGRERTAGDPEADRELICPEASADVEVEEGVVLRREGGGGSPHGLAVAAGRGKRGILCDGIAAGEDGVEGRPVERRVEESLRRTAPASVHEARPRLAGGGLHGPGGEPAVPDDAHGEVVEAREVTLVQAVEGAPLAGGRQVRELLVGERRLFHRYLGPIVEIEPTLTEEECNTMSGPATHV